jgi:glyoxylase-like metal-dependent hydrolase (beta-lactamase superfamily II)
MHKINSESYWINSIVSNQYLIVEKDGLTLIDAGIPGNAKNIHKQLAKDGFDFFSIKRIVITHADGDHYGAANAIRKETKAEIWAGKIEADAMKVGGSSRALHPKGIAKVFYNLASKMLRSNLTPVDKILENGETLPIGGSLKVIATPGHTPGHLSYYLPGPKILFCGDTIRIINNVPLPPIGGNTWDEKKAQESCAMQLALKPSVICAGHGYLEVKNA